MSMMQTESFTVANISKIFPDWALLLEQLSKLPIFENIAHQIADIFATGDIVMAKSNDYLIQQDTEQNDLYILLQGHLMITVIQAQEEKSIAEISPVDIVGEMSFFTNDPRSANVIALRDSVLIRLSRDKIFETAGFTKFVTNIAKIVTERLKNHRSILSVYKRKIKTITLIPAGDFSNMPLFAQKFSDALRLYGTVFLQNNYPTELVTSTKEEFMTHFYAEQHQYDYFVCTLDNQVSHYAMMCIDQTDHLVFVAEQDNHFSLNKIEQFIFKEKKYIHRKEFVLLKNSARHDSNDFTMRKFIQNRALNGYYNIAKQDLESYQRLARCVTGNNTCLVLSGGGARGLAHIGTIRALIEKKIPIDMIGGTSMGSLIAAAYARYLDYNEFYHVIEKFCYGYKFNKYTIPFVSVFTGQDFTGGFKTICGENTCIENLPLRYFAVACNLSRLALQVFNQGLLWQAVRASFSIPAILPPIINDAGEILVDGCVMNNLPVDQMQTCSNGGKIIASQVFHTGGTHKYEPSDGIVKGSRLLLRKLNPFASKTNLPNINFLFMKSLLISSQAHQLQMAQQADQCINHDIKKIGLFEFKSLEKIVEIGYQNAIRQLETEK